MYIKLARSLQNFPLQSWPEIKLKYLNSRKSLKKPESVFKIISQNTPGSDGITGESPEDGQQSHANSQQEEEPSPARLVRPAPARQKNQ